MPRRKPTRLLQVSDCHLARDPAASYRDQNADANLDRLMEPAKRWAPDLLVLTGDLSEDASVESYCRIRDWAGRIGCPVAWIPGNHDDRDLMAPVFDEAGFESGPVIETGAWRLALLDSAWPNDPGGELDEARLAPLAGLDRDCDGDCDGDRDGDCHAGIFVHHQPIPVGAAWIDKVGMRSAERLWARVGELPSARFIAFGHVHQRFRRQVEGIECLACPSTAANSLPATPRFTSGETTPMARWFVLGEDNFRSGYLAA